MTNLTAKELLRQRGYIRRYIDANAENPSDVYFIEWRDG